MPSRRKFLEQTAAAGLAAATSAGASSGQASGGSGRKRRIKSMIRREDTIVRYPVNGDNWHMSWAADDRQYISLCDGYGPSPKQTEMLNSRLLAMSGGPQDAVFEDVPGYPYLVPEQGGTRYYNFGTLALDGHIYQYMSTFNQSFTSFKPEDWKGLRFNGAKLIYSADNGRTWRNQDGSTPVAWEPWDRRSRDTLVFFDEPQEAFSMLSILQMGRDYEANRDGYVYVYAPNGNTEGTMNQLVMFRVPKEKILDRKAYEYFAGARANGSAKWVQDIGARSVVHTFPSGWVGKDLHPWSWVPSLAYNAPLDLYMMTSWGTGLGPTGAWFEKPSYLGFWTAPNPWGPWEQVHEETAWMPGNDPGARAYTPLIAPKWIAADGKSFWLVWTDFQTIGAEEYGRFRKEREEKKKRNEMTDADLAEAVAMALKHTPYYAFNVQRVDFNVA
jgi:hypothetical protein